MGEQLCHCGRPLPCAGADHDAMAVYRAERDALGAGEKADTLRAEIEAALVNEDERCWAELSDGGNHVTPPDFPRLAAAVLPLVEAHRLAARREALAEVRAGIEALQPGPNARDQMDATRREAYGWALADVRRVLDTAEASQAIIDSEIHDYPEGRA